MDNIGLVKYIADKFPVDTRMEFDDRVQEGCIGLIKAAREYKEGDVPFGAYAALRIRWAINDAMRADNAICTPTHIVDIAASIKRHNLQDMSAEAIAEKLEKNVKYVKYAIDHLQNEVRSLEFEMEKPNGYTTQEMYDFLGVEEDFTTGLLLENILEHIPALYRDVVRLHAQGKSVKEIAKELDIPLYKAKNLLLTGRARAKEIKGLFI